MNSFVVGILVLFNNFFGFGSCVMIEGWLSWKGKTMKLDKNLNKRRPLLGNLIDHNSQSMKTFQHHRKKSISTTPTDVTDFKDKSLKIYFYTFWKRKLFHPLLIMYVYDNINKYILKCSFLYIFSQIRLKSIKWKAIPSRRQHVADGA